MKPIFEEERNKNKNQKILGFLNRLQGISFEEIEQLKLITLWESCKSFDSNKGCKFSTHLYNNCRYTYLNFIKKTKKIENRKEEYLVDCHAMQDDNLKTLDGLPLLFKTILEDRFVYKYTLVEMSKQYNLRLYQIKELINYSKRGLQNYLRGVKYGK